MRAFILDLLFPRFCVSCHKEGMVFCPTCGTGFHVDPPMIRCPFCGQGESNETCESCRPQVFLDGLTVLSVYANPIVRELIHLWKYTGDVQAQQAVLNLIGRTEIPAGLHVGAVSPVPLAPARLRERGFDQADLIARALAAATGFRYQACVRRVRWTKPRAQVDRSVRLVGDLDHVFEAIAPVPEYVILCDDVFTSGATMDAAAKALKGAGAKTVWGFAVAKG